MPKFSYPVFKMRVNAWNSGSTILKEIPKGSRKLCVVIPSREVGTKFVTLQTLSHPGSFLFTFPAKSCGVM